MKLKVENEVENEAGNEDKQKRLPHERDESPDRPATRPKPRAIIKQAANDLERGLVDTDMHGLRGVEKAIKKPARGEK